MSSIPITFSTRFSFLGQSGWQGEAAGDAGMLFAPERLAARFGLFRQVALASLAAQTDPDFHLHVLTSDRMPAPALAALREMADAALGPGRVTVEARPPGRARKYHRQFLQAAHGGERIAQVVLDDDDGLPCDFVAILRDRIAQAEAEGRLPGPEAVHFVTFPSGYALVQTEGGIALYRHRYRFINLGLTMIGPPGRSIHAILHQVDPERYGYTMDDAAPMFLRSVHGFNDSRVTVTSRWRKVGDWRHEPGFAARFGHVAPLLEPGGGAA